MKQNKQRVVISLPMIGVSLNKLMRRNARTVIQ
jgi:hypothetical protein